MADGDKGWEREVIESLATAALREQRRTRRWGIFFKLLTFAYITFFVVFTVDWKKAGDSASGGGGHTALVELIGVIDSKGDSSAERLNSALQRAFKDKNTKGVILRVNSPGGSPVQSGIVFDEIRRQRGLHPDIPIYAVVEDLCASGGYYVASAADRIYVDKASIVGSIGVVMDGWGATGLIDKLGIERRVLTSGENKAFLDPFSPLDPKQKEHALGMLKDIHEQFIEVVKKGRGKRLKDDPSLFSGLMWTGAKSVELGLADGFGTVEQVARDVIKAEDILDFTEKENIAQRFAKRFGASVGSAIGQVMAPALPGLR